MKQEIKIGQDVATCENCGLGTIIKFGITLCDNCSKLLCVSCREDGHNCL